MTTKISQTNRPSDLGGNIPDSPRQDNAGVITHSDLEALKDGDHAAFEKIYLHFFNPLRTFLYTLLRSMEQAEEVCQDTFANLWHNREEIDPGKNIKSYLYTICKRQALNLIRGRKVHDTYTQRAMHGGEPDDSGDVVVARETELLINLMVSRMPKQRRKIFELSRYDGLSNDEISQKLGISKNAVEKQISFALKDIREILGLFLLLFI